MMQLTRCKLLVQGVSFLYEVRQNVFECINANQSLHSLRELMDEAGNDVIRAKSRASNVSLVGVSKSARSFHSCLLLRVKF